MKLDVEEPVKIKFRGLDLYVPRHYKELHQTIGYEKMSLDIFTRLIKPGSVFVDVGTHVGFFSILAAKKTGKAGKVFSFEPIPENITILKKNIAANKLENITILNKAVSSKSEDKTFKIRKDTGLSGFNEHPLGETIRELRLRSTTLDENFKNQKVDFIKIDTEGHEIEVLDGAVKTLKNNPGVKLMIELNPGSLEKGKHSPAELLERISNLGYDIYAVDDLKLRVFKLTNKWRQWREVFPEYGYTNLLCAPAGQIKSALLFSHTDAIGGAELAIVELADYLQSQDAIVRVCIPGNGPLVRVCENRGIATSQYSPDWWLNRSEIEPTRTQAEVEELIHSFNYDAAVISTIANPVVAAAAKRLNRHVFWWVHEDLTRFTFPVNLKDINTYLASVSDKLMVSSASLCKKLSEHMTVFKTADVLYPMPKPESIKQRRTKENPDLVIIGPVEPNKNQLEAIEALAILAKKGLRPTLAIIGRMDKMYAMQIKNNIKKHELGKQVMFLGESGEVEAYIASSKALLSCSKNESFGRTIVQAMGIEIPVIVSRSGGVDEYVSSKNALQYNNGDPEALAACIQEVMTNPQGNSVRVKLAKETFTKLDAECAKQRASLFAKIPNSESIPNPIHEIITSNYIKEIIENARELRIQEEINRALKTEYDMMSKEYKELIKTHQEVINSKAWKYAQKARSLIRWAKEK